MGAFGTLSEDKRLAAVKLAVVTACITGMMSMLAMSESDWTQATVELVSMVAAIFAWIALRKSSATSALPMVVFAVIGANVVYSVFETGGTSSVTIGWLPIIVIGTYSTAGRAAGLVAAVFAFVAGGTVFALDQLNMVEIVGHTPALHGVVELGFMNLGALAIIYFFEDSERNKFERELEAQRQVERMNADLQQALEEVAELESRLVETERHGSLQRLAGHFAHDFNNLLTGIMAEVDLAAYTTTDPELKEGLENALNSARKAADLTRSMLTYSGHRTRRVGTTTAVELFEDIQKLAELSTRHGVAFEVNDQTNGKTFQGDVSQLEQALLNLVLNSVQASEIDVPTVKLSALTRELPEEVVGAGGTRLGPGPAISLEVTDHGGGVPDDLRAAIFEPYFTTKDDGRGLGLSSVVGIVRAHSGLLSLDTTDGQTTFAIGLPLEAESQEEPAV